MNVALAQTNPIVGDIDGNTAAILERIAAASAGGADLVVFPELAVFGYPPKDLILRAKFVQRNVEAVQRIAAACRDITAIVGFVDPDPSGAGTGHFNAAAVCRDGQMIARYAKTLLPTYDVFDETRYFNAGNAACVVDVPTAAGNVRVGLTICEDIWNDHQFEGRRIYDLDPLERTVTAGAELVVNLACSPYRAGVQTHREALFGHQMQRHGVPLLYVNQVGGNDDLIFDGAAAVLDAQGTVIARAKAFAEDFLEVDLDLSPDGKTGAQNARIEPYPDRIESIRAALVLGIRDYLRKCGFDRAVIGLSGGIDSALTAALAVEALGPDHLRGVAMPSRYSSDHSLSDAQALADNLAIELSVIPIEDIHRAMESSLACDFAEGGDRDGGVAEENLQARIRGNILMALSNKTGALLLTTGNKSELAVGYCTLYGDMCGGLAVLSDVPKTEVYELARRVNASSETPPIPERTISKPPSAELRPGQCDRDTLPAYDLLDAILERYVERDLCVGDIVAEGFDRDTVHRVARMVDRNEYKRKQAPIGLRVTSRAFGTGRRMPIAADYG
ncbi:MAG: NAD+ synthase [Phycisphaerae bacterium]